jgi:hypothetical protein
MPFGPEPPVPNIQTVTITSRGFYGQEFEIPKPEQKEPGAEDVTSPSPDLFYSSSPEPDLPNGPVHANCVNSENHNSKGGLHPSKWHDLVPIL